MKPIAILSNKTRAEQRPPLQVPTVDASLLVRFGFKKAHAVPKPAASVKKPVRQKQGHKPASAGPSAAAQKPAGGSSRPAASPPKAASMPPAVPPARAPWQQPVTQQRPANQNPVNERPAAQRPLTGSQPPAEKPDNPAGLAQAGSTHPAARQKPVSQQPPETRQAQGLGQPDPKDQTPARKQYLVKPPQSQNDAPGRPADRLHNSNYRAPMQSPPHTPPARKEPPVPSSPPAGRDLSRPQPPAGPDPSEKRVEDTPLEVKPIPANSIPKGGNETQPPAKNGTNGARVNGNAASSYNEPRSPGENGKRTNGSISHTSLFRPGAFASIPTLRIPPKAEGPAKRPPTQIPMEVYSRPENDPGTQAKNEVPPAAPTPPKTAQSHTPGLDQIFAQNTNLPAQAAVIGVCEDGLPVLLDLADPAPGAMVVVGDEREAQLEILRSAVASVAGRNSPRSVQFIVFSCEPDAWQNWARYKGYERHLLAIESAEAETVRDWIVRLADWTEQRRMGQSSGPAVVLVMDTLSFLPALDYDIRLNFDWMAKEGPAAQIWPLAVISTDLAKALSGRRMLRAFQTRVMGYANHADDYVHLAGIDPKAAEAFGQPGEFKVKTGENWLRFRVPGR